MIREYLEQWRAMKIANGMVAPLEDLVLAKGIEVLGQPLPEGFKRGKLKACFANAGKLALKGWPYVEGYAASKSLALPMPHAWVLDGEGGVVDPTWEHPEDCHYMGVLVPPQAYARALVRNRVWGVLDTGLGPDMILLRELMIGAAPSPSESSQCNTLGDTRP